MADLALWKLVLDGALVVLLMILAVRAGRGGGIAAGISSRQLHELEDGLRRIVKEADMASSELGKDLQKRKRELEELLFDVKSVESRLNSTIDDAEEIRRALVSEVNRASGARAMFSPETQSPQVSQPQSTQPQQAQCVQSTPPPAAPMYEMPEPPSFDSIQQPRAPQQAVETRRSPLASSIEKQNAEKPARVNIYGEPLPPEPETVAPQAAVQQPVPATPPQASEQAQEMASSIEDVYAAAEELLQAGQDMASVAAQTSLPMEEIQMLSRLMDAQSQTEVPQAIESDPRLGALSQTVRRERQVI